LPICLSPIFIQQSFAVTADTTVLMFALIFSAYLTLGESFEKVDFTLLVITGLLTTLSKIPYSPLLLLPACFSLLEKTRIQKRDKLLVLILISSGAIGFIQYLINLNQKSGNQPYSYQTQLDFILNHPFETFKKLSIENIKYLTHIPLFSHLGWMDVPLTKMTRPLLALLFIITITPLFRRIKLKFNKTYLTQQFTRISLFMIFVFISSMLFSLAIFVTFRPGGQYIFSGLQLRYYLPFWIIATAFVPKIKIEITKTFLVPCVFISALYIAYTVMPLLVRYY
jgi:hypothetical protein